VQPLAREGLVAKLHRNFAARARRREGLQRKSFFAVCGKKDWSGKPGPAAGGDTPINSPEFSASIVFFLSRGLHVFAFLRYTGFLEEIRG
jgi:hypothetical protein